jgi:hypothetical protein
MAKYYYTPVFIHEVEGRMQRDPGKLVGGEIVDASSHIVAGVKSPKCVIEEEPTQSKFVLIVPDSFSDTSIDGWSEMTAEDIIEDYPELEGRLN